jgi:hypothetical protein
MKVYKSEWDKYGWRWKIHQLNDGSLKFFQENNKRGKNNLKNHIVREFSLFDDGLLLLNKVLKVGHP